MNARQSLSRGLLPQTSKAGKRALRLLTRLESVI